MVNITTNGGLITFQDTSTGVTKQIGQNRLWLMFKGDTVNFLQVDVPTDGYDGTPFWSCRASNMTINGQTYTIEQLKNGEGLDGMFSSMSFNIEIVEELPETGDPSTIYLIYDDETGSYTEYLWLSSEQVYEELGSVADVDLGNYYTKTQIDQLMAAKANLNALSAVATSGSYNDLSDKPVIPTVPTNVSAFTNDAGYLTEHQSLSNYYNKSQTDNLLNGKVNTGSLATVATTGSYTDLTDKPDMSNKQDVLVSGVNIKTINSQSLLGEGNINIEGGGQGTQVQSNWNETNTASMAFIQNKPTNVSSFNNDAGYLTSHQSLSDVFADVAYDSSNSRINFYGKGDTNHTTVLAYVDASDFVVDGMVEDVRIENGNLIIDFNTDSGITDISIPLTNIFNPNNYYTKTEVENNFATLADVENAYPYIYEIGTTDLSVFNEVVEALVADGRSLVLFDGEDMYMPATWKYSSISPRTFRFTVVKTDGTVQMYTVKEATMDRAPVYNSVEWNVQTIDETPYFYAIEDDTESGFLATVEAINGGRVIMLTDKVETYPATYNYDETNNQIIFTYVIPGGTIRQYTVTYTPSSAKAPAVSVVWEMENFYDNYHYGVEEPNVSDFDYAVQTYMNDKVLFIDDYSNGFASYPSSVYYDEVNNTLYLSYLTEQGEIKAWEVVKQQQENRGETKAPVEPTYEIVWTDVSPQPATVTVDSTWVQNSTNPVQSQLIQTALAAKADSSAMTTALAGKQDTLTAGTNITISNGVISATGGSTITVDSALSSTSTNPVENRVIYNAIGDIEAALQAINGTTNS